jgi:ribosomal protein S18 acetylase RimI-like enzyme
MTSPTYRFATAPDAEAIVALIETAYRSPANAGDWDSESHLLTGPRTSHEEIARLIADPDSRFLLAETGDGIAGCCLVQRRAETDAAPSTGAYFGMFAIDPRNRAGGLGKALIAQAEREVVRLWRSPEMVMTVINVRDQLIAWYQRRGYALTGNRLPFPFSETSGETTRDFDLVEMRKPLA